MILASIRPYYFTAVYKGYTTETSPTNPDAEQKIFSAPVTIKCSVNNNPLGELTLVTNALLQNGGLISDLRTTNPGDPAVVGTPLLYPVGTAVGAIWRIIEGQPLTDAWGNKGRYRYRCLMIVPQTGSVTEVAPSASENTNFWTQA